jgi:hypothetical protein
VCGSLFFLKNCLLVNIFLPRYIYI